MAHLLHLPSVVARASAVAIATVTATYLRTFPSTVRCEEDRDRRSGDRAGGGRKRARETNNPCEEFNKLKWRLTWATRRDDCNFEPSCVFIGRSITGACVPRDPSMLRAEEEQEQLEQQEKDTDVQRQMLLGRIDMSRHVLLPDETGKTRVALNRHNTVRKIQQKMGELQPELESKGVDENEALEEIRQLLQALDVEDHTHELAMAILKEQGTQAVQDFFREQLIMAAAEEMRSRKLATEAFAKDFLIKVIGDPDLPGKAGQLLESIFKDPALSRGVRTLVYDALRLEHTVSNSVRLTTDLMAWLLTGTDWMDDEYVKLLSYLVRMSYTKDALVPLVEWVLVEPGVSDPAVKQALLAVLPLASEAVDSSFLVAAIATLKSDWALQYAKDTVQELMQSRMERGTPEVDMGSRDCSSSDESSQADPPQARQEAREWEAEKATVGTGEPSHTPPPESCSNASDSQVDGQEGKEGTYEGQLAKQGQGGAEIIGDGDIKGKTVCSL
ncbi:unnamed protein product [Discosporangium mesarthrocarpum]